MREVELILVEQFSYLGVIQRIAKHSNKALYQSHILGNLRQTLSPLTQSGVYYLAFGIALGGARTVKGGVPCIVWLVVGLSTWIFLSTITKQVSSSVHMQVGMVSRMKFPISIPPMVKIFPELLSYSAFTTSAAIASISTGEKISIYWTQLPYYIVVMIIFLYSFDLINSTIAVLIRGYQTFLNSITQVLVYMSGAPWDLSTKNLPFWLSKILMLNPYVYIINGFRDIFFYKRWFLEDKPQLVVFWLTTLVIFIVGAHLHAKFRSKSIDYM